MPFLTAATSYFPFYALLDTYHLLLATYLRSTLYLPRFTWANLRLVIRCSLPTLHYCLLPTSRSLCIPTPLSTSLPLTLHYPPLSTPPLHTPLPHSSLHTPLHYLLTPHYSPLSTAPLSTTYSEASLLLAAADPPITLGVVDIDDPQNRYRSCGNAGYSAK